MVVSVCHVSIFGRKVCLPEFLRSRAVPTRPKSEKPRKSREGKRSKRLKWQQQERKEKYRKRQCRANHQQHHELSKLSATHDMQHRRSGKKFHGGARSHAAEMMRFRLCSELGPAGYQDILGRNNSAIAPNPLRPRVSLPAHPRVLHFEPIGRATGTTVNENFTPEVGTFIFTFLPA